MPCSDPIIALLAPFRPLFTAPTWKKMQTLLTGTLLARGRRTVTAALWQTGHQQDPHFNGFHHVLNRAHWSPLEASQHLLALIVETLVQAGGVLDIVLDETLERRWGAKIRKRGHYRDSALSSRKRSVSSPGLRWIVLAVVVTLPWTQQRWALPFLATLATTPEVSQQLGLRHKTIGMRAHQLVSLLRRWLPGVPIKLMGDLASSILELGLHCAHQQITLIGPFRLDSVIHQPAPARRKHTLGRPPSWANACPPWNTCCMIRGRCGRASPWTGMGKANGRWSVVVEPPAGIALDPFPGPFAGSLPVTRRESAQRKPCFPLTRANPPRRSSAMRMKRWSLEATFEESRAHLGLETQRQWSDLAIERTTPLLFGLFSLVTLFGHALAPDGHLPLKQAAWYHKQTATLSDILALVRRHLWGNFTFPTSPTDPDVVLVPRSTLVQLAHAVCY